MQTLNLPKIALKVARRANRMMVFDTLRRRYVALTPEEWVRQHFVHFLILEKGYPTGLIANEVSVELFGTRKRCDTVVYAPDATPLMIVEYKAPDVEIDARVFQQISRYNISLHVRWLIVSNGLQHYCCRVDYENGRLEYLTDIPTYDEAKGEQTKAPTAY
ncbi:MAG: type I restriction enzyme HsdR N-terminal domain-containing protein [Bacteroidaceae bacterium]|nr:type I restriction enzyme HsdR N-terminal domain-containing protein [Bacteroidaceae bacterium]